jgi:WD40-like Beta Propeller Repeat
MRHLALLVVMALSSAAPAHAAPEHAEIAFVTGADIWAARADGSERQRLARGEQPAWSPDGSRLAYVRGNEDESQLMVLGAGPITPLRKGVSDVAPSWSPDGTALVFSRFDVRNERYRSSIVVVDVATGAERVLVTKTLFPRFDFLAEPDWSPAGATIAYAHSRIDREHDIRPDVWTIPAAGGTPTRVIRDGQSPDWSPDGARLAYGGVRDRNGKRCSSDECWYAGELYTAAADGSDQRRLTRNQGDDTAPEWSPDGSRILFTSDRTLPEGGSAEVYSVAADGSCLTWVTNGTPASGDATWRRGTGSRFDPGGCDPATRAPVVEPPPLPDRWRGLWLGPRYGDRLFSRVENGIAHYDDCVGFERCPTSIALWAEPSCRGITYRGLDQHRLLRVRGALVAYFRGTSRARVFSGSAATLVQLGRGRLKAVRRVIRALRPRDASAAPRRLAPPRLPRALARRLGIERYTPC